MKKRGFKIFAAISAGAAFLMSMGWPFFRFVVCADEKKDASTGSDRKKWYTLKHTIVNHPGYNYKDEYESAGDWCKSQDMKQWYIRSDDGLKLHASLLPAGNADRIVILCHGYRGHRFGSIGHAARLMHDLGCTLLFIDQRCCGESGGSYITFGAREQYDILSWLKHIQIYNKDRLPVYLYGQSMGAASVLLASGHGLPDEVCGLIADCGFHSMKQQLRDIARGWFHLHWIEFLLLRVDIFCRIIAGFSMRETDTTNALKSNDKPVLFFHGEADTYVWPENTVRNYSLCRAEKELVLVPDARHLCCSFADPGLYRDKLVAFFAKNDRRIR